MAIALDTSVNGGVASGTSLTYSHTCSGSDRILVVGVLTSTDVVTGVTYNGVSMTLINKVSNGSFIYTYYLINPASGANNVVISTSSSLAIRGVSASYTGVKQSGQPDASTSNTGAGSSVTTTVTTIADNCWTVGVYLGSGTFSSGAGLTLRQTNGSLAIGDSNAPKTPAGSTSMTCNNTLSGMAGLMSSFSPGGKVSGFFMLL